MKMINGKHSPLCKIDPMVAWRCDMAELKYAIGVALNFIENRPPNIVFKNPNDDDVINVYSCKYCGHPQVQHEPPRHEKHCIIRIMRKALRMSEDHFYTWHYPEHFDTFPQIQHWGRSEKAKLRAFFRLMDKGGIKLKEWKPIIEINEIERR